LLKKVKLQSQKGEMTWSLAVLGKTEKYEKGVNILLCNKRICYSEEKRGELHKNNELNSLYLQVLRPPSPLSYNFLRKN